MSIVPRCTLAALAPLTVAVPLALAAQVTPPYAEKRVPAEEGFRVYLVPDMEGMGSAVQTREVIAGTEGEAYRNSTSTDYWDHYRRLLTAETNAAIRGARAGGAKSFVVNEGHGGNRFANILPWELDPEAILIRGYPKPMVMSTGIDSSFGTMMFTGAHANYGSPGVMSHNYAFAVFTVNDRALNEVGINALVAGEYGVSVSLVSGDDQLVKETQAMLGNGVIGVVVKTALGRHAAITYSPARVQTMLEDAAREAVRRELRGDFIPFKLNKPYRVAFTLRPTYPDSVVTGVDRLMATYHFEKTAARSYTWTIDDARQIAYLLDAIEKVVLP